MHVVGLLATMGCGYSTDMLTTISTDSDMNTAYPTDGTEFGSSTETDTDTGNMMDTESVSETQSDKDSDSDSAGCSSDEIQPSEVLLIGDSWISLSATGVGERAKSWGSLSSNEDYVYQAASGATIEDIVAQYDSYSASSDTPVKVVIMNGGGVDTFGGLGSEDSLSHVIETFTLFLSKLAQSSSVDHVIYSLYAEGSSIPGIAELRSPMKTVCAESLVPCHFLDLQPLWEEHSEYISSDTINPSAEGASAIASAIWSVMQHNCIAQ